MPDERRPDDDPLVRYWDEVVRDHPVPPADLDPPLSDTIHRVHARDDAPAPDQFFVTNLWEDLMLAATPTAPLVPNAHLSPNGTAPSRPHSVEWPAPSTAGSQRRWSALATAALLVLMLGGTFIAFGWPRRDRNDGAAIVTSPVHAQSSPETAINPAECQTEPRTVEGILALWYPASVAGTPVRAEATREMRTSVPVPLGEPADAKTIEGINATFREAIACINAGEVHRFLALLSDDYLRSLGAVSAEPIQVARVTVEAEASPMPLPVAKQLKLLAVTDVSVMANGRVGAFLLYDDPQLSPPTVRTLFATFVEERGRWVFDEFVEFTGGE